MLTASCKQLHQRRLEGVRLALLAVADEPEIGQLRRGVGEGLAVTAADVGFDLGQPDAAEPRRRAGEVAVDQLAGEPERLEDLGAAVAHGRRDAHLRGDLEEPLLEALQIVPPQLVRSELLVAAAAAEAGGRGESEVGIDRGGAVADETGEGVDVADLAALDDDVGQIAQPGADQRVMDGAGGEQHRHRRVALVDAAVGEDQDAGPAADGGFRLGGDALDRGAERRPGTALASASEISNSVEIVVAATPSAVSALDGVHRGVVDGDARELEQPRLIG